MNPADRKIRRAILAASLCALLGGWLGSGPTRAETPTLDNHPQQTEPDSARRQLRRRPLGDRFLDRFLDANPTERRRMRQHLRERWRNAEPGQRAYLRDPLRERRRQIQDRDLGGPARSTRSRSAQRERLETVEARRQLLRALPPEERRALGEQMREMSPAERREVRKRLQELPETERQALANRLHQFRSLDPGQQEELRQRMKSLLELPEADRERLRANTQRWRHMTPEERRRMRDQMQRLRAMPEAERLELLNRVDDDSP